MKKGRRDQYRLYCCVLGSGSESGYRMMEGRTMRSVASGTAGVWAVAKASFLILLASLLFYPISAKTDKWMDTSHHSGFSSG